MKKLVLKAPYTLEFVEDSIPQPRDTEVRIKVKHIGVCGSDPTIYRGLHPYVSYPLVMGHEISGIIDECGKLATKYKKGDRVAVIPHKVCGKCKSCKQEKYNFCEELKCTGAEADGAHAEFFCIEEKMIVPIPDLMSLEDASMLEPACVAYHGAKRGHIESGDNVLIIGAGPIGQFCLQSCYALGAGKVFVADMDDERLALSKSLGATEVINVAKEDLQGRVEQLVGNNDIQVFYDCVGEKGTVLNNIIKMAKRGSRVVVIGVLQNGYNIPNLPDFVQHELSLSGTTMYVPKDYYEMVELMNSGKVTTKGIITHHFNFDDLPDVLDKLDKRQLKACKIVINM